MDKKFNVLGYAIIIGLVFYIFDSVLYYLEFSNKYTFLQALLTDVPTMEIFSRLIMIASLLILGLIINGKMRIISLKNQFSLTKPLVVKDRKHDFDFLSSLSFQIRTPLSAIIGFTELLKKQNLPPESKETYLNHISSSSKYLLLLINNLSEISKIESNDLSINKLECNINKIIEDQFSVFQTQKEEYGKSDISLIIENILLNESFFVLTDQKRLIQVIHNLLENALINTDRGLIKIGYVLKENGFIEFYISDTGNGFSQERLEIIFKRYNKLTDNHNLPFDGTVLRLAIAKSLVKMLGGEIWANSKIGQGTIIYFTIPYLAVPAKPEETPNPIKFVQENARNWPDRLILISEDVPANYFYLEELLKPTKIKILWAKNGKEAVDFVKTHPKIELILMDILMPEMDGYQASKEIKAIRKDLPIIAQTACIIEGDESLVENFDDFLTKPIWSPQLLSAIEKYIF